ncbi:rhodanese-like domain-containing protein [Loktanella sp. F6476L]|uniref:rhodanese-like domain-containing protein n=1 Tax=Loktanella sp. F6476L TaxID=2926405 RepID=UPI001FF5C1A5|nr:rhodanese-like domain-containing protein [Loktanella sp. F6476L]MCK0120520.1 rhodanese-like domain-containing protein [Loktanella sp. F6476L]
MDRRAFLGGGALVLLSAGGFVAADGQNLFYSAITEDFPGGILTAPEAFDQTARGEITLIDIRRPDEWARTGSGEGAHRIDLRDDDFAARVQAAAGGDLNAPVALICARGVRSARVSNQLIQAGFTNIIDIPEGMLGSAAGPGWIARGLPLVTDN